MRIGHFSDLHGNLTDLLMTKEVPDVWVCTGDIFPNSSRGILRLEVPYQTKWFENICVNLTRRLAGKPLLYIGGNHDFIDLARCLTKTGYPVAHTINLKGVTIDGVRFSGFREIPWICGEWNGEAHPDKLTKIVADLFKNPPDVLLTHCPPAGILDGESYSNSHHGIGALTNALTYSTHKIKAHLFGHCHDAKGEKEEMGVKFYNSATTLRFIDL